MISVIEKLKPLELLDVSKYEDEYVATAIKQPKQYNDSNINMNKHYISKNREKFRVELKKGVPVESCLLYTHHFNNNKPSVWIIFKVESDKYEQQFTEGVKSCSNKTPTIMHRH